MRLAVDAAVLGKSETRAHSLGLTVKSKEKRV